ncbi:MAG TPA: vWA domain-containing protein [Pyrinomonadaceae bacterium]|nr:vWA domain-containing protein [Pyrinomonadaceae bacterium]
MSSTAFALKVLGTELLTIAVGCTLVFFYAKSFEEGRRKAQADAGRSANTQTNAQTFAAGYMRDGKSMTNLLSAIKLRGDTDLITFVIDTSQSMDDDRQELRENIRKMVARYKGKSFELVDFTDTAMVLGDPTREAAQLEQWLDSSHDLGGPENSYRALSIAAAKAHERFKNPALILITDAAPNDSTPGSSSHVTLDQAADAINAANAELYVLAAYDQQEAISAGTAATSPFYPQLVNKINAGGQVYMLKRNNFDPNSMGQTIRP